MAFFAEFLLTHYSRTLLHVTHHRASLLIGSDIQRAYLFHQATLLSGFQGSAEASLLDTYHTSITSSHIAYLLVHALLSRVVTLALITHMATASRDGQCITLTRSASMYYLHTTRMQFSSKTWYSSYSRASLLPRAQSLYFAPFGASSTVAWATPISLTHTLQ